MKIIKPSVFFFGAVPTDYKSALKFIEMAGRTCYQSEDKITEDSAEGFVKRLAKAGHLAMLEHSNFVVRFTLPITDAVMQSALIQAGKYLEVSGEGGNLCVGGNLTAWANTHKEFTGDEEGEEAEWFDVMFAPFLEVYGELFGLEAFTDATPWEECPFDEIPDSLQRYAAKFVCDRGVSHELVRHRPCSFAQESTRYVNYGGKDMEFIEPAGYETWGAGCKATFEESLRDDERVYEALLRRGLKPQQARAKLPNALRTEIVVTADAKEWAHIRKLRTHKSAHPDIVRVMNLMPWGVFCDATVNPN